MKWLKKKQHINHHFIFIEAPVSIVGPQAVLWGEASWWPKDCLSIFTRLDEGQISEGTVYKQKIQKMFVPSWKVKITKLIPGNCIERTFLSGIFKGYELIKIGERANGTRIDYELHYRINGPIYRLVWPLVRSSHDKSIKKKF